ncbi:hypothetical protein SM124_07025 [Bacillus sp. 31A1R]|uniref:Spore coat protein n=1 Tax=Robertmurraya mangrovi TaxID=3098077 RepID=A0ABU5IWF4_9BACI|nr:hypothetical protein [Bacillus sp. 31A1R]MDZ5471498.1 hypothetical protein [Bacillus sp. 31A1R]
MNNNLGLHETLELHELLLFKNTCLTKANTLSEVAQDQELKNILKADAKASQSEIQDIQKFLS